LKYFKRADERIFCFQLYNAGVLDELWMFHKVIRRSSAFDVEWNIYHD